MSPETFQMIVGAVLAGLGAFTALRTFRSPTRISLLGTIVIALAMLLLVRLTVGFGGWSSWFIYVWLACVIAFAVGVYLAAAVWPGLPWRAAEAKKRRTEAASLGFSGVLFAVVAGLLVVPGLLLG